MRLEIYVQGQGQGQEVEFFRADYPNKASIEAVAKQVMYDGAFDRTREQQGRIDYYPPSQIVRIQFTDFSR